MIKNDHFHIPVRISVKVGVPAQRELGANLHCVRHAH